MHTQRYEVCTPTIAHQCIGGEVVIVDLRSGYYYSLLGASAEVWMLLDSGAAISEIATVVAERYQLTADEVAPPVSQLVAELMQDGLIRASSAVFYSPISLPPLVTKAPFAKLELGRFTDMRDLILLDPIHEVDEGGWPNPREAA